MRYKDDWRNPLHDGLSYRFCQEDYCVIHYEAKATTSTWPLKGKSCRWQWQECVNITCKHHLWDKRTTNHFPHETDQEAIQQQILINEHCTNAQLQTCMRPECERHLREKAYNGFEHHSFLGRNQNILEGTTRPPMGTIYEEPTLEELGSDCAMPLEDHSRSSRQ